MRDRVGIAPAVSPTLEELQAPPRGGMWPAELCLEDSTGAGGQSARPQPGWGGHLSRGCLNPESQLVRPEAGGAQAEGAMCRRPGLRRDRQMARAWGGGRNWVLQALTACPVVRTWIWKVWGPTGNGRELMC